LAVGVSGLRSCKKTHTSSGGQFLSLMLHSGHYVVGDADVTTTATEPKAAADGECMRHRPLKQ
jgi:hypothetical protein